MCMLFLYVNPNPGPDGFLLVLASVRDEFYYRPTKECHFWEKNPNILGGMDLEDEKVGGTWLAMNTAGKIATVLNVMQPMNVVTEGQMPRGFLAVRFLESQYDGPNYLTSLMREPTDYSAYTLVTIDVSPSLGKVRTSCYSNISMDQPVILRPGFHSFGNSTPRQPWKKVSVGKQLFSKVVNRHRNVQSKEALIADLFGMLQDERECFPDQQLQSDADGRPTDLVQGLSSIFIKIPQIEFGTRTHSLILVDVQGNANFVEKTMQDPMNSNSYANWAETRYSFAIQDQGRVMSHL